MIRAEQIKLYESYADGILTRNEYLEKKKGLGEKLADLQEKIRIEEEEQETADELDEEIRSLTKAGKKNIHRRSDQGMCGCLCQHGLSV